MNKKGDICQMPNEDKKETLDNISLTDLIKTGKVEETSVEEKSPLQRMKEYKESHPGMIVDNSEVTYDNEKKVLKNSIDDDERRESDFKGYMADMDRLIDAAQSVTIERPPKNEIETAAMIDQLDRIAIAKARVGSAEPEKVLKDVNGKIITLPESEKNGTDLRVPEGYNNKFFKEKTEDTPENDSKQESENNDEDVEIDADAIAKEKEEAEEHEKLVNILIDKTGFGNGNIDFTEEEREKLSTATEIRVTEVENLDIDSYVFDAPDKTYVDSIDSMDSNLGTTVVPLVASRYRAKMRGLGYGQLGDILLSGNEPSFEQTYKRFSTIYNNIVETTIGKFESFEDFLKKTAFIDMNMLVYGLIVSTYPEIDSVNVTCGKCGKTFEQKYFVRDLMDLSSASNTYLKRLDKLMSCPPEEFKKFAEEGPVRKRKYIVLPASKYVAEIGVISAYDHLYQVISNMASEEFKSQHDDDINGFLKINYVYLNMVRSISIPNPNKPKSLIKYSSFEDVLQIIYRLPMEDQQILSGLIGQYAENYGYNFSIKNDACPYCHNRSERTEVDLNELVFFKIRRLMNTGIRVENMLDL